MVDFTLACKTDNLELFIKLCKSHAGIDFDDLLKYACSNKSFKIIKWIIKNKSIEFINILSHSNLKMIKYLYEDCSIKLSESDWEKLFFNAFKNNKIELVKWILQINPCIEISMYDNAAFYIVCINNYLELAQLLVQYKPDIILINMDPIWYNLTNNNLCETLKWLIQINPLINTFQ